MSDATVVGSAAFELRATKSKIHQDLEDARRVILEASKRTEAELAEIIGTGTDKGNRKAAASFQAPKAAGIEAGAAIRESMRKAGEEIGEAVAKGSAKAKAELDALAQKARQVQPSKVWVPDDSFRLAGKADSDALTAHLAAQSAAKSARTDQGVKRSAEEIKALNEKLKDIEPSAASGAEGLGKVGKSSALMSAAVAGAAAVISKISFDAIVGAARNAARAGAEIANTADNLSLTTDRLQELQFAASETKVPLSNLESGLTRLNTLLGQFRSGIASRELKPAFDKLGIKPEDLKSIENADQFLILIAEHLRTVGSEAEQAALLDKLQIGDLLPMLKNGSKGLEEYGVAAHEAGRVLDEAMVRKLAEADAAMEKSAKQLDNLRIAAFAPLAETIGETSTHVTKFISEMEEMRAKAPLWQKALISIFNSLPGGQFAGAGLERAFGITNPSAPASNGTFFRTRQNPFTAPTNPSYAPRTPRKGNADALAAREARREERVEQEIFAARQRLLGAVDKEVMTVTQRYELAKQETAMQRQAEQAELDSRLKRKDLDKSKYDLLVSIRQQVQIAEDQVKGAAYARDLQAERIANERLLTQLSADLLTIQSGAAKSAAERRRIEMRLLQEAQRQAREDLVNDPRFKRLPADQQQQAIARQDAYFKAQSDRLKRDTMSPLERWRDESLKDADQVSEALENVAARGLDRLNDGLVDAILNSRSLGETFSNVARQILADLLSISIRSGIIEPLAGMLFGGGEGSGKSGGVAGAVSEGGGWLKRAFSLGKMMFGFADGRVGGDGKVSGPGGPRTDSIFALLGQEPVRISTDESIINAEATRKYGAILRSMNAGTFDMRKFADGMVGSFSAFPSPPSLLSGLPSLGGQPAAAPPQKATLVRVEPSKYFDVKVSEIAAPQAAAAFSGARQTVPSDMAKTSRYTRGRRS